jgi:hypothetical protein
MKLGFTGTQKGMTDEQILTVRKILNEPSIEEVHSGDCIGADTDFIQILTNIHGGDAKYMSVGHIPDNDSKRSFLKYGEERKPKPYLERNHDIVDESDVLLATPKEYTEQLRSGTWTTVRYAKKQGKKVILVYPNGKVENA